MLKITVLPLCCAGAVYSVPTVPTGCFGLTDSIYRLCSVTVFCLAKKTHTTQHHNCLIRWHYNSQVSQSGVRRIFWLLLLGFHFLILFEGDDIGEVSPYVCFLISVYGLFRHYDKEFRTVKTT